MTINVSRQEFENRTGEILNSASKSGDLVIVTDGGLTAFEVKPFPTGRRRTEAERKSDEEIKAWLRGTVTFIDYDPFKPVGLEDWEALK